MAYKASVVLFLVLFRVGFAQIGEGGQGQAWEGSLGQQGPRLRAKTDCRINRLNSQQPNIRLRSELGETQLWDKNSPEFVSAGVEFIRYANRPGGLLLPGYSTSPQLVWLTKVISKSIISTNLVFSVSVKL